MSVIERLTALVAPEYAGKRLDQVLAQLFPAYSRTRLQEWLADGQVLVDGRLRRGKDRVEGGERVELTAVAVREVSFQAEAIPLDIVYEDAALLVINKPAGLVVHPAAGNWEGTLLNALLHHAPELEQVPRAGIVHRLDKDTSGLLVVARTLAAQKALVDQMKARQVEREYDAITTGVLTAGGTVNAPIGRHLRQRKRMAVTEAGKTAVSHYRVAERFRGHTYVKVRLETGRTHQIRVHMAHIHHPLVGDPVYGGRLRIPAGCSLALAAALRAFDRQALHAGRLALAHPATGEPLVWQAPLPRDMQLLLECLREDVRSAA